MKAEEIWKDIEGYEGRYKISNKGRVLSLSRYKQNHTKKQYVEEKIISNYINNKNGYVYVYLCKDGKYKNCRIHRLVAETFIPNPNGFPQVNHIDGDKTNNNVENLEWCTASYNIVDYYKRSGAYDKDVDILNLYNKHKNCAKVAKIMNMTPQGINGVLKRMGCHIYSLSEQRKMNDKRVVK